MCQHGSAVLSVGEETTELLWSQGPVGRDGRLTDPRQVGTLARGRRKNAVDFPIRQRFLWRFPIIESSGQATPGFGEMS